MKVWKSIDIHQSLVKGTTKYKRCVWNKEQNARYISFSIHRTKNTWFMIERENIKIRWLIWKVNFEKLWHSNIMFLNIDESLVIFQITGKTCYKRCLNSRFSFSYISVSMHQIFICVCFYFDWIWFIKFVTKNLFKNRRWFFYKRCWMISLLPQIQESSDPQFFFNSFSLDL